ncbi:MAG: PAS domain-containing methyl-accepting chemotaxis protein [Pseudomonadota bacterium]
MKLFAKKHTGERRRGHRRAEDALANLVNTFQAVIHFQPDGTILFANDNFLDAMGYTLEEVKDRHHSMFCDPELIKSDEYKEFWQRLASGEAFSDRFKRLRKDGSEIWIKATYAPSRNPDGEISRVSKVAVDVTDHVEAERVVNAIKHGLTQLKNGDMSYRVETASEASAELARLYNEAVTKLDETLARSGQVSASVSSAAQTLESASMDLSNRTETQAAAVEETAAAVRGLTDDARERAEQVRGMEGDTSRTLEATRTSREVVVSAIDAMDRLEKNSAEIAKIVSVIDDISFQTSLLALNAGVEAARAGEAGRGFAVVAQEVRGLAQRAAESAREIKALIEGSSEQVAEGVQLVRRTGDELTQILDRVGKVSEGIADIAVGVTEQAGRLNEIDTALTEIDGVTQSNAAMVNQNIDTCQQLASEATELRSALDQFTLALEQSSKAA